MTATAILKLEKSGFTTDQVEALAEYLDDQLVTKTDLEQAKTELKFWMTGQGFVIIGVLGALKFFG